MANAKKCDRCGNFYTLPLDSIYVKTVNGDPTVVSIGNNHNGLDLCEDCRVSFIDWWTDGKKEIPIIEKSCGTCKYEYTLRTAQPCIGCYNRINICGDDKWEAKDNG